MSDKQVVETVLTISLVFCFLGFDVVAWWMLVSGEIEAIRRTVARMVRRCERDHRVESYIKGLRRLAEDE